MVSRSNGERNTAMTSPTPIRAVAIDVFGHLGRGAADVQPAVAAIRAFAAVEVVDPGDLVPGAGRRRGIAADHRVDGHGRLDLVERPADLSAAPPQDLARRRDPVRLAVRVPYVGVPGGRAERLGRAGPADQDREPRLDRERPADRVIHAVETPFVRHPLPVEQPADQAGRLVEAVQPLAEPRAEVDPEGLVLAFEPAAAEAEDDPPTRQVVDGRGQLRGQAGRSERVGADEQPEAHVLGQDGQGA